MGYLALYLMFWNCLPVHYDFEYVTSLKKKEKKEELFRGRWFWDKNEDMRYFVWSNSSA